MEIKQIIVDELPNSCLECHLQHIEQYGSCNEPQQEIGYWCEAYEKEIESSVDVYTRPTWCPLVIENECVWEREKTERGWAAFYIPKDHEQHRDFFTQDAGEYKFCPNCGRKIRYEEE